MIRLGTDRAALERAAALLADGKLVAIPTETVYGLAADASSRQAVARIFTAKERPADHPLIVHLPGMDALNDWAAEVPASARKLAEAFWPGPLTLILPRSKQVLPEITGGQNTVALRVPGHPITLELLGIFGGALAAPSANRFGRISPTRAEHVMAEFTGHPLVAAVIDGGPCQIGVESTIVDCSQDPPRILRPGMIGSEALGRVLGRALDSPPEHTTDPHQPRSPGNLASHYAPLTPTRLVGAEDLFRGEPETAVLALDRSADPGGFAAWISLPAVPDAYAHGLYAALRKLDRAQAKRILIERPPDHPAWAAIHDRLGRASQS